MTDEKKRIIKKVGKISACVCGGVLGLLLLVVTALVVFLPPERLTPIVENAANDYLNADVKLKRVELSFWSTFPDLTIDAEGLDIKSKALTTLTASERAQLPANADSLLTLNTLHGGVNVFKILYGTFSLKDLAVDGLRLNLVSYSPKLSNYDIAPASEEKTESETTLPTIYWNKLHITDCKGISYYDRDAAIDVKVDMPNLTLDADGGDNYRLVTKGKVDYAMNGYEYVKGLPYEFDGDVEWKSSKMLNVGLNDMKAKVIDVPIAINMKMDIEDKSMLEKLNVDLGPMKLASVVPYLPVEYQSIFAHVESNITARLKAELQEPYDMGSTGFPTLNASLEIPDSYVKRMNYRLDKLGMTARLAINGKDPRKSNLELEKFILEGHSMQLDLKGGVEDLFADAHIKGGVKGNADLGTIMEVFNLPLNFSVKGVVDANANVDMHLSDLEQNSFQKMKIDGTASLSNFSLCDYADTIEMSVKDAQVEFGNKMTAVAAGTTVNELMRFGLKMRGFTSNLKGMRLAMNNAEMKAGCVGDITKLDSTHVVPFGGKIEADNLTLNQPDSSQLKIDNLSTVATLTRFHHSEKLPKIHLGMSLGKIKYKDHQMVMSLHDGKVDLSANARQQKNTEERKNQRLERLRQQNPGMSNDSLLALASRQRGIEGEVLDMSVGGVFKDLLLKWQMQARLQARRGKLFTPYFPLKNRLQNVDASFSMDSILLRNVDYKVGHSTFNIRGGVHNMRTNLLGRNRRPLDLRLYVKADTLDVNQILKALAAGTNGGSGSAALRTAETEAQIDHISEQMTSKADESMGAILVPGNLNATIALRSHNVLYGDLFMTQFNGDVLMHDRVLNLHELSAKTDMGSARFNALYVAPDANNMKFSMDLGLQEIEVGKFLKLIPRLDSIMSLLNSVDGVINADLAATADLDSVMNVEMPTLKAAVKLSGRDLVFMDAETFKKVARMLLFKNKNRNVIDKMTVEMLVDNSQIQLFPFMFDVDRYRLGVLGYTNMDLDFRYHISVLKSPIPFKFGINIYGNPDKMHFRFGGAKYKKGTEIESMKIVDTTRVNLRRQISTAFRKGAKAALRSNLRFGTKMNYSKDLKMSDELTHEDSLQMMKAGMIEMPAPEQPAGDGQVSPTDNKQAPQGNGDKKSSVKKDDNASAIIEKQPGKKKA